MEKIIGIIDTVKNYTKFIAVYLVTLSVVSFVLVTEISFNNRFSFSFYCIIGSTAAVVAILHRGLINSFKEGYQEGYDTGQLDNGTHWKKKYDELLMKHKNDGLILPMQIGDNCKILSVEKMGGNKFIDSVWLISGVDKKLFFECYVVRGDDETFMGMVEALKSMSCAEEISTLDQRKEIGA